MLIRKPVYYSDFACLAGACPDTCCAGWEVCIDEDSLARYRALPGPLGEAVRAAIVVDEEGDACFCVENGHCALQRPDGLCPLQAELGPEALCDVCDAHPRFTEEYGSFRETMLAASCPEAARLMLSAADSTPFAEEVTDEADVDCDDVDEALLAALLPCREQIFGLLREQGRPVGERAARALACAAAVQDELDMGETEGLTELDFCLPEPLSAQGRRETALALFRYLGTLELLTEDWRQRLAGAVRALEAGEGYAARLAVFRAHMAGRQQEYENLCVYFIARRFLAADFDADVYGKTAFMALSLLVLEELGALELEATGEFSPEAQVRLVGLWCKEQEHCDENLEALGAAAYDEDFLRPNRLGGALLAEGDEA